MFAALPELHYCFSVVSAKTTQTAHATKQCYHSEYNGLQENSQLNALHNYGHIIEFGESRSCLSIKSYLLSQT